MVHTGKLVNRAGFWTLRTVTGFTGFKSGFNNCELGTKCFLEFLQSVIMFFHLAYNVIKCGYTVTPVVCVCGSIMYGR